MAAAKETAKKGTGNTALDAVMSQIRKEFGEMSIMRLGDQEVKENTFCAFETHTIMIKIAAPPP